MKDLEASKKSICQSIETLQAAGIPGDHKRGMNSYIPIEGYRVQYLLCQWEKPPSLLFVYAHFKPDKIKDTYCRGYR